MKDVPRMSKYLCKKEVKKRNELRNNHRKVKLSEKL